MLLIAQIALGWWLILLVVAIWFCFNDCVIDGWKVGFRYAFLGLLPVTLLVFLTALVAAVWWHLPEVIKTVSQ